MGDHDNLKRASGVDRGFSPDERSSALIKLERFVESELALEDDEAWGCFHEEREDRLEELKDWETEASEAVYDMWFFCDHRLSDGGSVVESFLEKGPLLSPGERRYLRLIRDSTLRLYEVEDLSPGESITLVELPSLTRVKVHEHAGSRSLWRHALIAARTIPRGPSGEPEIESGLLNLPGLIRDWLIPEVAELREVYRREHPAAAEIDFLKEEMAHYLHDVWISSVLDPQIPRMKNTDGEDLLITRIRFDVADPAAVEAAFDKAEDLRRGQEGEPVWLWSGNNGRESPSHWAASPWKDRHWKSSAIPCAAASAAAVPAEIDESRARSA